MGRSAIEYVDYSQNFWRGCHKVSAGCKHCYAERIIGQVFREVARAPDSLFNAPLHWKPGVVLTCSMSDFWIEEADEWRAMAFDVIRATPALDWLIFSKRWGRAAREGLLPPDWGKGYPNVWAIVSVEDQAAADKRVPELVYDVPALHKGLSLEPLIGPVDVWFYLRWIDWLIVGGESGLTNQALRPLSVEWVHDLISQAEASDTPLFFKQWGGTRKVGGTWGGRELDGRTYDGLPSFPSKVGRSQQLPLL